MKTRPIALVVAAVLPAAAHAGHIVNSATSVGTSSTIFGGDRRLDQISFTGHPGAFTSQDFLRFQDGRLTNNVGTFGWNDAISRDVNSSNNHSGNPDRADSATAFLGESGHTGTLSEVFGAFGSGYKNMSYIIDGEDNGAWTLDLFFAPGQHLDSDATDSTLELSILERGGNSDMNVYGIGPGNSLTPALFVSRANMGATGWSLDTLEIGGNQNVTAVGISLDDSWDGLVGIRIEAKNGFNGPDLVAVGAAATVPSPAPLAVGLVSAATLLRRRR
jgi:hypothetical protein